MVVYAFQVSKVKEKPMAIDINKVANDSSTTPANSEVKKEASGVPEKILAMPIFKAILEGAPAALWTPTGDKSPEAVEAVKAGKDLNRIGLFFYRDDPTKTDVLYNAQFISPELIKTAAKKGKLREVASNLAETVAAINGTGAAPEAGDGASPAAGMPSPVPVDSALNTARVNSLQPGGPTSGNFPGAGRVLNGLTQSAI